MNDHERRASLMADAKTILDRVATLGRDLTDEEQRTLAGISSDIDRLDRAIKADSVSDRVRPVLEAQRGLTAGDSDRTLGDIFVNETRALVEGSGSGAAIVNDDVSDAIYRHLAKESVAIKSGIRVIKTTSDTFVLPHITADPAAAAFDEAATITAADPTITAKTVAIEKYASRTIVSNELAEDTDYMGEIGAALIRSVAAKVDLDVFEGDGTPPAIRGLRSTSGISEIEMAVNGAALADLDEVADAFTTLASNGAEAGAIVMAPRTWKSLLQLKKATGSVEPLLLGDTAPTQGVAGRLLGVPVYLHRGLSITETQGTANNASSIYIYQPNEVVMVVRKMAELARDPYSLFSTDQSQVRLVTRVGLVVPNATSVVRIKGIIP